MATNNNSTSTDGSPIKSDEENVLSNFDYTENPPMNSAPLPTPVRIETIPELVPIEPSVPGEQQPVSQTLPPAPPQSEPPAAPQQPLSPASTVAQQPLLPTPPVAQQPLLPTPPVVQQPLLPTPPVVPQPLLPTQLPSPVQPLLPEPVQPLLPAPVQPLPSEPLLPAPVEPLPSEPLQPAPPAAAAVPPSVPQPLNDGAGPSQVPAIGNDQNEESRWDIGFINGILRQLGGEADIIMGIPAESSVTPRLVPYTPGEFNCNECFNLRDILHTNGIRNVRMTLHGGTNVFDHLLFQIETFERDSVRLEYYYLDLSSHSFAWTKWLIVLYLNYLMADGVAIMMDTTSSFYEGIENGTVNRDAAGPSNTAKQPAEPRPRARSSASRSKAKLPKTGLALQRERASRLTPLDLSPYFRGPISLAARALGLCSTAIKHACRRLGILRWPSRKLNSLDRQIGNMERELATATNPERIRELINSIEKLKAQYQRIMNGEPEQEERAVQQVEAGEAGEEEGEEEEEDEENGEEAE